VHPRIGAADVVPFIPIEGVTLQDCVQLAERVGHEIWNKLRIPVYFYEAAANGPAREPREHSPRPIRGAARRDGTAPERHPDVARPFATRPPAPSWWRAQIPDRLHINLGTADVGIAKKIAKTIRFSSGGLRCVKLSGWPWPRETWRRYP